ncbi:hypothetical protein HSB1_10790 [Halogranum salarium B-1]|uniref:Uncharacterized protein n=1 Tax=Halogranum salarium B-1 TaxID=1210908 RepID=J3JGX3_9EURY|nr:hypothetical protein HSB1_10790 [Halogranum salarium B-1]
MAPSICDSPPERSRLTEAAAAVNHRAGAIDASDTSDAISTRTADSERSLR